MRKSGWFFHCRNRNQHSESMLFELHLVIGSFQHTSYTTDYNPKSKPRRDESDLKKFPTNRSSEDISIHTLCPTLKQHSFMPLRVFGSFGNLLKRASFSDPLEPHLKAILSNSSTSAWASSIHPQEVLNSPLLPCSRTNFKANL